MQKNYSQYDYKIPITIHRVLLVTGDLISVNISVLIALKVWSIVGNEPFNLDFIGVNSYWFVALSILWLTLTKSNDSYNLTQSTKLINSQVHLLKITLQLFIIYIIIFFLSPRHALPRLFILYYAVSSYILIAFWRIILSTLSKYIKIQQRILIIGQGSSANELIKVILENSQHINEIIGTVDETTGNVMERIEDSTLTFNKASDLANFVKKNKIKEIILANDSKIDGDLFQAIMDCYELGITITPMPLFYEQLTGMVPVEFMHDHWNVVLPLDGRNPFHPFAIFKRSYDFILSFLGLIPFYIIFPFIALIIKLDSPGPVFYKQQRVGRAGRTFNILKLRTMIPEAEPNEEPAWASKNDPRITRIGKFLRKSRIDEIPQLFNVLKGDMSLVGPRPERPYFIDRLQKTIPFYRTRLSILPGITGWAQINYGYGNSEEDALIKLKYDLYYIRHRSVFMDIMILLRTIGKVMRLMK